MRWSLGVFFALISTPLRHDHVPSAEAIKIRTIHFDESGYFFKKGREKKKPFVYLKTKLLSELLS